MKKIILPLIAVVVAVSMCVSPFGPDVTGDTTGGEVPIFYIGETMDLPKSVCDINDLHGKVVVIHQTGCGACEKVVPVLNEIEQELNLTFEYINLKEDPSRMYELRIQPFYVPTVIVDCTAYVSKESVWSKEKYKTIIMGRAGV